MVITPRRAFRDRVFHLYSTVESFYNECFLNNKCARVNPLCHRGPLVAISRADARFFVYWGHPEQVRSFRGWGEGGRKAENFCSVFDCWLFRLEGGLRRRDYRKFRGWDQDDAD